MLLADGSAPPEFNWSPYIIAGIPGVVAIAALLVGKFFDFRQSRRTSEEQAQHRREPTWPELVNENRALRTELSALDSKFDEFKEKSEKDVQELKGKVSSLEIEQKLADRREVLLYQHTKALRNHIINELPPPPPTAPTELIDWFRQFEETDPGKLYPR
jgi:hypothetical protein